LRGTIKDLRAQGATSAPHNPPPHTNNTPTHQHTNKSTHQHTSIPTHQHRTNIPKQQQINTPADHTNTNTPLDQHTNTTTGHTNTQAHQQATPTGHNHLKGPTRGGGIIRKTGGRSEAFQQPLPMSIRGLWPPRAAVRAGRGLWSWWIRQLQQLTRGTLQGRPLIEATPGPKGCCRSLTIASGTRGPISSK
jgi:hypothetical protein